MLFGGGGQKVKISACPGDGKLLESTVFQNNPETREANGMLGNPCVRPAGSSTELGEEASPWDSRLLPPDRALQSSAQSPGLVQVLFREGNAPMLWETIRGVRPVRLAVLPLGMHPGVLCAQAPRVRTHESSQCCVHSQPEAAQLPVLRTADRVPAMKTDRAAEISKARGYAPGNKNG